MGILRQFSQNLVSGVLHLAPKNGGKVQKGILRKCSDKKTVKLAPQNLNIWATSKSQLIPITFGKCISEHTTAVGHKINNYD